MSVVSKIETLSWFILRPSFYPHLLAMLARIATGSRRHEGDRPEATQWAADRAVDKGEALAAVGLHCQVSAPPLELIKQAETKIAESGVVMGGAGDLTLLHSAVVALGAKRVIETGVAYGWSSLAILTALEETGGRLISVDMPYPKEGKESFVGMAVPDRLHGNWTLIRQPDRNGLKIALRKAGGAIDLAHYDSDKSYAGRMYAYPIIWDALRDGGLFISDDIQDNFAFRDFFGSRSKDVAIVESQGKYVGIVRKNMT